MVEYVVMELKGTELKRFFIPLPDQSIMSRMLGVKLSKISGGKLYYLVENEDEEQWKLFEIDLNHK
jgi:hypothetical protein